MPEELCEHPGLMTEDEQTYGQFYDGLLDRMRVLLEVMDKEDFSRGAAIQAAAIEEAAQTDQVKLTAFLLRVALEASSRFSSAIPGMRCVWPLRAHRSESEAEEIRRRFRSEAMNPLFIEGMAAYGRRGAMALAAYVARSCQWDASCQGLAGWMYEAMARTYALHPEVQRWMREVCPGALRHLTGSLLNAAHGSRWHSSLKTRTELTWLHRSLEKPQRIRREWAETGKKQA